MKQVIKEALIGIWFIIIAIFLFVNMAIGLDRLTRWIWGIE